jgi:ribosomal protein S18 acetylase RimI-like enzyme
MPMRVWVAELDEAEVVAQLLVEFRNHMGLEWPSDNAFYAGVERLLEDPDTEYLLGSPDDDSPPAGVVQLRYRHALWWAAEDCTLEDLFIRAEARGSGLGRTLVEATIARARERGCRRIELDVWERNEAALALYRSLGFKDEGDPDTEGRHLFMRCHLEA